MKTLTITLLTLVCFTLSLTAQAQPDPEAERIPTRLWTYTDTPNTNLRVWYQRDNFEEERIALFIMATLSNDIIPAEEKLMGRRHGDDSGQELPPDVTDKSNPIWPNGGDGKLDVYLFDFPPPPPGKQMPHAWTKAYPADLNPNMGCPKSPAYMAVNLLWARGASQDEVSGILAHEYFHVLQSTYDMRGQCKFYRNMIEGLATYAIHYVYPKSNVEHKWFSFSEDARLSALTEAYSTWLFYLYLANTLGEESIPALHEAWASDSAFEALDRTLEGGLKKHWLDFAVKAWNQEPLSDSFLQWDDYAAVPGRGIPDAQGHLPEIKPEKVVFDANGQYRYEMNMLLRPMSRDYYAFDVSGEDVRSVSIDNPVLGNLDKMNVKLLVKRRGPNRFEEILWEEPFRKEYLYCLDKKDYQDLETIVLVAANYQHTRIDEALTPSPSFKATNQGCHSFKGTVRYRQEVPSAGNKLVIEVEVKDFTVLETGRDDDSVYKNKFLTVDGSVTYKVTGKMGECEANAAGSLTLLKGPKAVGLQLDSYQIAPLPWGTYNLNVKMVEKEIAVPLICARGGSPVYRTPVPITTVIRTPYPHHGGKTDLIGETSNFGMFVSWELRPIKE